ncbi:hypothetical protein HZH68_001482 [Vespula germanica]|uniref:Uncharacterized protein n=1 Tax=Vespula germanica TaxID=30212 RepID=A0A834NVQ5_VESGE|nr:hypothetical protein HZH68_001482 [Vespula germanica]
MLLSRRPLKALFRFADTTRERPSVLRFTIHVREEEVEVVVREVKEEKREEGVGREEDGGGGDSSSCSRTSSCSSSCSCSCRCSSGGTVVSYYSNSGSVGVGIVSC